MRRATVVLISLMLLMVALAPSAAAQCLCEDQAVGSWVLDTEPANPDNPLSLMTIHADGTIRDWTVNGTGVGTWVPGMEAGIEGTILYPAVDPDAGLLLGFVTARITGEVSEDGSTISGAYTAEFPVEAEALFPPAGEYGPGEWIATRILVEPMGEPVGPLPVAPPPAEGDGEGSGDGDADQAEKDAEEKADDAEKQAEEKADDAEEKADDAEKKAEEKADEKEEEVRDAG
jgi:hypothetical protein